MDDLRHILHASPAMFCRFASIMQFMNWRRPPPKDAGLAAQMVAVTHDDGMKTVGIADPTRNRTKRSWTV